MYSALNGPLIAQFPFLEGMIRGGRCDVGELDSTASDRLAAGRSTDDGQGIKELPDHSDQDISYILESNPHYFCRFLKRKKTELNVLWHSTGFQSGFVSSVCLLVRVTIVDKKKQGCRLLRDSLSELRSLLSFSVRCEVTK